LRCGFGELALAGLLLQLLAFSAPQLAGGSDCFALEALCNHLWIVGLRSGFKLFQKQLLGLGSSLAALGKTIIVNVSQSNVLVGPE
jgi:hypothetical protein